MTNRREFLQTGAAMSVLAMHGLVPRRAGAAAAARTAASLPHRTIYDERYPECRAFAAAAAAFGANVQSLKRGDVTALYDELDVAWRGAPTSTAGTTQFGPMLVLERLAAERGMRLVLRVEHRPSADGTLSHVINGPSATLTLAAELDAAAVDWPVVMAALVCRATPAPRLSSMTLATRTAPPALARDPAGPEPSVIHYYLPLRMQQGHDLALDGPLYSWLLAPVSRS